MIVNYAIHVLVITQLIYLWIVVLILKTVFSMKMIAMMDANNVK